MSSGAVLTTHHKIQSQIVAPFRERMDAKLKHKEATSPVANLNAIGRPNGFKFPPIQREKPPLRAQPQSVNLVPNRLPLAVSKSNQPRDLELGPTMNADPTSNRKLRSWTTNSSHTQPLKRHSVGRSVELTHVQHDAMQHHFCSNFHRKQ